MNEIDGSLWSCEIEVSGICNLKCVSCPYTQREKDLNTFMDVNLFEKTMNDLHDVKRKSGFVLALNQFGEETLHPKYSDILDIVEKHPFKLLTSSNATKFTRNISERFVDMGKRGRIFRLQLSLYGVDETSFVEQTGVNLFEKSYQNVKDFIEIYDANNSTFEVYLKIIVSRANRKLVTKSGFSQLFHFKNDRDMKICYLPAHDWLGTVEGKKLFPKYCNKISSQMAVFPNGDVSYCCYNCFHDPVLGNVRDNSLREIWYGELATRYRSLWFSGRKQEVPLCNACGKEGPYPNKNR